MILICQFVVGNIPMHESVCLLTNDFNSHEDMFLCLIDNTSFDQRKYDFF